MNNTEKQTKQNTTNLSDAWQSKFAILEKVGASDEPIHIALKSDNFKQLSASDKRKISFNLFAFIFGPFYYFFKQMWQKGAFILGAYWLYTLVLMLMEAQLETTFSTILFWLPTALVCCQLATFDYFRLQIKNEKMWPGVPQIFSTPAVAIGFPVFAMVLILVLV